MPKTFSKKLREYREKRGWSRPHMSKLTNISVRTIEGWEGEGQKNYRIPPVWLQEMLFRDLDRVGLP